MLFNCAWVFLIRVFNDGCDWAVFLRKILHTASSSETPLRGDYTNVYFMVKNLTFKTGVEWISLCDLWYLSGMWLSRRTHMYIFSFTGSEASFVMDNGLFQFLQKNRCSCCILVSAHLAKHEFHMRCVFICFEIQSILKLVDAHL